MPYSYQYSRWGQLPGALDYTYTKYIKFYSLADTMIKKLTSVGKVGDKGPPTIDLESQDTL